MTTINQIAAKIAERKAAEEAMLIAKHQAEQDAAAQREADTEAAVEEMMDNADTIAFFALKLREVLEKIERPLISFVNLCDRDAEISLEMAQQINADLENAGYCYSNIFDGVETDIGSYDEYIADESEDEGACDCCVAQRAAEEAFAQTAPNNPTIDFIIDSIIEDQVARVMAGARQIHAGGMVGGIGQR